MVSSRFERAAYSIAQSIKDAVARNVLGFPSWAQIPERDRQTLLLVIAGAVDQGYVTSYSGLLEVCRDEEPRSSPPPDPRLDLVRAEVTAILKGRSPTNGSLVHVHTQCEEATVPYVFHMWRHALRLADDPRRVIMTVHCIDGGDGAPYADLFKSLEGVIVVRTAVPSNLGFDGTSLAHARCVQDALSMTRDGSIHVISDSDAFVVMRRWDEYVRARLDHDDGIGMLGTTYEPMDGWSSGSENVQTYKGAPSLTWCALNPRHDWSKLDVSPCKGRYPVTIGTDEQSGIYGLPVGVNVLGEVGWRIPQFLHDEDVTYHGMKHLKGSRDAKVLKGLSDYHEEYVVELEGIEVPFIAHHRGSLRHPFKASEMSAAFFNRIEGWIESQCLFQHT